MREEGEGQCEARPTRMGTKGGRNAPLARQVYSATGEEGRGSDSPTATKL